MKISTVCLIVLAVLSWSQGSEALTLKEITTGYSIANKLKTLTKPTYKYVRRPLWGGKTTYSLKATPGYLDFMLILDSSGSIGLSEFKEAKGAAKVIVDFIHKKAPISKTGSRVALIEFSEPAKTSLKFKFGLYNNVWAVERAINNVDYDHGASTATALALNKAKTEFQQPSLLHNGKVAWIITDGNSNIGGSPITPANNLKNMGVTVCAVAVGKRINMVEIKQIASPGCVYEATSYSSYMKIMQFALKVGGSSSPTINPNYFSGIKF